MLRRSIVTAFIISLLLSPVPSHAENKDEETIYDQRMALYEKVEAVTHVPWYYLAAIDQYERNVRRARRDIPNEDGLIGIYFPNSKWAGPFNPNENDTNPISIQLFGGMGQDGDDDKKAEATNDEDVLYSFANYIASYGVDKDNIHLALWHYYERDKTVGIISGFAKLYKKYGLILEENAFPIPLNRNYSYRSTWGDRRGWGGRRIHEGTDIFADYGVPVRSTSYGVIELVGWNRYGGWRVGIRDIKNNYHYYAHLNGFEGKLRPGQIVEPGQTIGYVGSSGYGPPGTSGKFPPHLHYGMYKDNGITEWSFDPYPHLKAWERAERMKQKKKK